MKRSFLAICLLFAIEAKAQSSYASYEFESAAGEETSLTVTPHTVRAGETIEDILEFHGVQPNPVAVSSVLDENPSIRDKRDIKPGMVIRVPQAAGAAGMELAILRSPGASFEATQTAANLDASYRVHQGESRAGSLQAYAIASREAAQASNALTASALSEWSLNGELVTELARNDDPEVRSVAYAVAEDSAKGLRQASAFALSGRATRLGVRLMGVNPPKGRYPPSCRIRYSLWGHAYSGQVEESNIRDAPMSGCASGFAQIEALVSYGFWTEWLEGTRRKRSEIKRVRLDPDSSLTVDLPMQPFK